MTARAPFKDHFSSASAQYARFRPDYPDALFRFLAEQSPRLDLALDCATGSGQAALGLSRYFAAVVAIDASEEQLAAAIPRPNIRYRRALVEQSGLPDQNVDLVAVAQALHWFRHRTFFAEARRILRPGGLLAAWCYRLCTVNDTCDAAVRDLYDNIVAEFWPPERQLVDEGYASIEFPQPCIDVPEFYIDQEWRVSEMLGYLRTWSACRRYQARRNADPVAIIKPALTAAWGDTERRVRFPVTLRACRF